MTPEVSIWVAELAKKQAKQRFWEAASAAFRIGFRDCMSIPTKAIFDRNYNEYDHDFNPYMTRSDEWTEYRAGCREYYDRHIKGTTKEKEEK